MAKEIDFPITPAVRVLKQAKISFTPHLYDYVEKGGTEVAAESLGVAEHLVVKTIVLEDEKKQPLIVLIHGDKQVSTKKLGRILGKRSIIPCSPETVSKHTGYLVGGTSPLGSKKSLPVYIEESVLELTVMYLNGGKRGFLVGVNPRQIKDLLKAEIVSVSQD